MQSQEWEIMGDMGQFMWDIVFNNRGHQSDFADQPLSCRRICSIYTCTKWK